MKINKVKLHNFSSYEGNNEFDFEITDAGKNIVLIGGKNGAGKTSLFTAIKVALYGPLAYGYVGVNSHYISKIKDLINSKAFQQEVVESEVQLTLQLPFYLIHSLVDDIGKEPYGKIINIGSDADHMPFENASVYCATKFGLFGMTESLRIELKKKNIGITTISPARVDTYFNNKKPGCRPISLKADDVAEQVYFVLKQRSTCNIEQIKLSSILE